MTPCHDPHTLSIMAQWVIARAATLDVAVIPDAQLRSPIAVNRTAGAIWIRPDLNDSHFHWLASRGIALIELGPKLVRDFIPPADNVTPLLRRPW